MIEIQVKLIIFKCKTPIFSHIKSCYLFKFYFNNTAILYVLQLVIILTKDTENKAKYRPIQGLEILLAIQTVSLLRNMKH